MCYRISVRLHKKALWSGGLLEEGYRRTILRSGLQDRKGIDATTE
jgi:hypothetical protein